MLGMAYIRHKSILTPVLLSIALLISSCDQGGDVNDLSFTDIPNYKAARQVFWSKLYNQNFETLYCGEVFNGRQAKGVNIEHVFPMSWVTNGLDCGTRKQCRSEPVFNRIEADLHNLYPSLSAINQARGSLRFGVVSGEKRAFGRGCDFEVDLRARIAEPRDDVRGDVARAMFYMQWRYSEHGLVIFDKQAQLLRRWHQLDPPTEIERQRNKVIETLQGNRNPYIDTPSLLE